MTQTLFQCTSTSVGGVSVPAFAVARGEQVCLHFPPASPGVHYAQLYELPGRIDEEALPRGMSVNGRAVFAEKPMYRPGFLWRRYDPTIFDWLTRHAELSVDIANEILNARNVPQKIPIGTLQWQDRAPIGVATALAKQPDILIYDASGSSEVTAGEMHELVARYRDQMAVVYFAYPFRRGRDGPITYNHLPGARCIDCRAECAVEDTAA